VNTGFREVIGSWKIIAIDFLGQLQQVLTVEGYRPGLDASGRGDEPHHRQARNALAAARLADDPERAAFLHLE
jgi:hypothetical protein